MRTAEGVVVAAACRSYVDGVAWSIRLRTLTRLQYHLARAGARDMAAR